MDRKLGGLILLALTLALTGCATAIMKSYVGKSISEAMMDYGQPVAAFDIGPDRRAFQWRISGSYQNPTYATTNVQAYGNWNSAWATSNTTISGGGATSWDCLYTLTARWDGVQWLVDGFRKPSMMCM